MSWIIFWKLIFFGAISLFVLLFLVVSIGGFSELKSLFDTDS